MGAMPQPSKCPKTGTLYYRKVIPKDLRSLVGRGSEWKVSLGTKSLAEARSLFAAESERCESSLALARSTLKGLSTLLPSDAPKLADRWIAAELSAWERTPNRVHQFLAWSGDEAINPNDVIEDDTSLQGILADAMRHTLAAIGHPTPPLSSPAYKAIYKEFFGAWRTLCETALQRHSGDWRTTPTLSSATLPLSQEHHPRAPTGTGLRLSQVLAHWTASKRQDSVGLGDMSKTIAEYEDCMLRLIHVVGDVPAAQVSKTAIHNFRVTLGQLPKGRWKPGMTVEALRSQVEQGSATTMSLSTIRKKLQALSTIFRFASDRLEALDDDPVSASGVLRDLRSAISKGTLHQEEQEKGYTRTELVTILSSPLFRGAWEPQRADYGRALHWLPLLMTYTGARREEVAQLLVSDLEQDEQSGVWCMAIRPGEGKSLKTASSRRRVPLHDDLIALGLLDYKNSLPATGRLFPKLKPHKDGLGHAIGKTWDKYLQDVVKLQTTAKPAHGFRHAFKTLCREVGIPKEVHDWLTGHAASNVGDKYGSAPISRMEEELKKFPSIARMAGLLAS